MKLRRRLPKRAPYKGKDIRGKLYSFNSERADYASAVLQVIHQISPRAQVQPAH